MSDQPQSDETIAQAYEGKQCGKCGDPIKPGVWCGNDDCPLGGDGPTED